MSWPLRWIIIAPVVLFVALTMLMSSCGGSSSCNGSFDAFGNFIAGACPTPGPQSGFQLQTIVIGEGAPVGPTPTPGPTPTFNKRTPTPTRTPPGATPTGPFQPTPSATRTFKNRTPTPTPTLEPQAEATTGVIGEQIPFNAEGLFVHGKRQAILDITNSSSTLWTTMDQVGTNVLRPPQPPPAGGIYAAVNVGCACITASSGGVSGQPVSVSVLPAPQATPVPPCPVACVVATVTPTATTVTPTPTATPVIPTPTATATSLGAAQIGALAARTHLNAARSNGILLWTFHAISLIASQLRASSDGNLYFLTRDGNLHALNAKGRERWSRPASGQSIAVSPDGTVYALGTDGKLVAQSPIGKPLWSINAQSSAGPLAASSSAVYFEQDRLLFAASSPGLVQWQANAPEDLTSAIIAEDGSIIAGAEGGEVVSVAPDGSHRWSFSPAAGFTGDIATRDGVVYLGSRSGRLYAVNASNGDQQWSYDTAAAISAGPAVNGAGPILFGSDAIYALNSNGSLAWGKPLASAVTQPIVADGESGVFAPLDDDISAILNPDGSLRWATKSFGAVERAVISPSGVLYVATNGGTIYAVR